MGYGMGIATGMLATALLVVPGVSETSSASPSNTVNMQPMAATQCKTGIKKFAQCKLKKKFPLWKTQWGCLDKLWIKESGWRWWADNPNSDAYGIPQANPGSKMKSAGSDWRTNPRTQINWGLDKYIYKRYGTPCAALKHHRNHGWY